MPLFLLLPYAIHASNFSVIEQIANVSIIKQDQQGFIWLAGQQGLTRYDGNNSITFSSNNANWPLPFFWIQDATFKEGNIVLATETSGLWEFDPLLGEIKSININAPSKTFYSVLFHENAYYAYAPGLSSLYRYSPNSDATELLAENIRVSQFVNTKVQAYFYNETGVYRINDNAVERIFVGNISAISAQNNTLIFASKQQLHTLNDNGIAQHIDIVDEITAMTTEYEKDNVFTIDVHGQLKKYSTIDLSEKSHHFPNAQQKRTTSILHDSSDVIWAVSSQGISRLAQNTIKNHTIVFNVETNTLEAELYNNNIIIGSYGQGLSAFPDNKVEFFTQLNQFFSAQALRIMDIVAVDDDLYIATFDGLWRYQANNKQLKRVDYPDNNQLLLRIIHQNDLLYLATDGFGLQIFDLNSQQIIDQLSDNNHLSSLEIIDVLPLNDESIWLATAKGVDIYNRKSKTVHKLALFGASKVISLVLADNKIFASTMGDGIFVFNRQGELLAHFGNGLHFTYMAVINDEIWAPALPGLYRINPSNYQLTMVPNTQNYSFTDRPVMFNDAIYVAHYGGLLEIPVNENSNFNPHVVISQTTVSGKSYLLNKSIELQSANDVVTLTLASLDYRPGQEKQYQYRINNGLWNQVNGSQLTLTGLASGFYHIEIMATNSLGQWSRNQAFTEINVAFPWYWSPQARMLYLVIILSLLGFSSWLLILRAKSINHVHRYLQADIKNRGNLALSVKRNLIQLIDMIEHSADEQDIKLLLSQSIEELTDTSQNQIPDALFGNSLLIALPYLGDYLHRKYHVNVTSHINIDDNNFDLGLTDDLQSDIYKVIYEALTSVTLNSNSRNFKVVIRVFNEKLWLTIHADTDSFTRFTSTVNFDMAMYFIRQIAKKYNASVNAFDEHDSSSQLMISFPFRQELHANKTTKPTIKQ